MTDYIPMDIPEEGTDVGVPAEGEPLQDAQEDVDQLLDWEEPAADAADAQDSSLTEVQEQEAVEALSQIEELQPEVWAELDDAERQATAQEVENIMADIQGRTPVPIEVSSELGPGTYGGYSPATSDITVSEWHLEDNDVHEFVNTIVHEGRHAYQDFAVQNPGFHPNDAEVSAWAENMLPGNYLTANEYGQEIYQSQPVEADAWNYGNTVADALYWR